MLSGTGNGDGWEGVIGKRRTSVYEGRRSKEWIKLKALNEQELVIIGFNYSSATTREIGALHLGFMGDDGQLHYGGKVGTGFTAKMRGELRETLAKDVVELVRSLGGWCSMTDKRATGRPAFVLNIHHPEPRSLFRLASAEFADQGTVDAGRIAARVQDADLRRIASELSVGALPDEGVASDTMTRLKVLATERHIVERKSRLRALDPDRDAAAYDALFEELLELEKHKRSLSVPE